MDIDRLTALLPHADPTGIRHVGAADAEVIEQATAAFVRQDFAPGAGPIRDVAVAQLRTMTERLVAELAGKIPAGWADVIGAIERAPFIPARV